MVLAPEPRTLSHYNYDPSFSAAIVVGILYSLAFFVTFFQWLRYNAGVWAIMVVAAGMEGAGYIIRAISSKHVTEKSIYMWRKLHLLYYPLSSWPLLAISFLIIYHVVPKEARTSKLFWIPPRFIIPIFVNCDILALLLQLISFVHITSIDITSTNAQSKLTEGENIALVGVAIQMACFGLLSIIAIRFNFTSRRFTSEFQQRITLPNDGESKNEKYVMIDGAEKKLKPNWQALLHVVNITRVLILIRSIFRMVDFALGGTGYTEKHEWCVHVFDTLPVFPYVALSTIGTRQNTSHICNGDCQRMPDKSMATRSHDWKVLIGEVVQGVFGFRS
ncbi:hypothetical protein BPAE_0006g00110 [Botrytis paeoniae]|uniref:RTA1 domain protein n=1 Tax=Botrytis paeoniae TaxID=278948 RepID=A0A4Z1G7Q1_9HELO|nr:hypothetical protein BPAE_0006g00110 [Botrytis paeoniae]